MSFAANVTEPNMSTGVNADNRDAGAGLVPAAEYDVAPATAPDTGVRSEATPTSAAPPDTGVRLEVEATPETETHQLEPRLRRGSDAAPDALAGHQTQPTGNHEEDRASTSSKSDVSKVHGVALEDKVPNEPLQDMTDEQMRQLFGRFARFAMTVRDDLRERSSSGIDGADAANEKR